LSNFAIKNQESSFKGSYQTYNCNCTLTKSHAVFNLDAIIQYYYDGADGWIVQPITVTPKIISVSIEGDWIGTYRGVPYSVEAILSISKIDDDGSITAVYSYSPSVTGKYSEPGSYNVSGKIDMSTLNMNLVAGDWVNQPANPLSIAKIDIGAMLYVDDSKIVGRGQEGNIFTVSR
jgi:hypothetical protein